MQPFPFIFIKGANNSGVKICAIGFDHIFCKQVAFAAIQQL